MEWAGPLSLKPQVDIFHCFLGIFTWISNGSQKVSKMEFLIFPLVSFFTFKLLISVNGNLFFFSSFSYTPLGHV